MEIPIKLVELQFAFIDISLLTRPDIEYHELNKKIGNLFNSIPLILPIGDLPQAPPEIPIVQAHEMSLKLRLNIAKNRIDFFKGVETQEDISSAASIAKKIISRYKESGVGRVGIVGKFIVKVESPSKWIKDTFFEGKHTSWSEIGISYNIKSKHNSREINNLINIQEAEANENGTISKCILIQKDINTSPTPIGKIPYDELIKIIDSKISEFSISTIKEVLG